MLEHNLQIKNSKINSTFYLLLLFIMLTNSYTLVTQRSLKNFLEIFPLNATFNLLKFPSTTLYYPFYNPTSLNTKQTSPLDSQLVKVALHRPLFHYQLHSTSICVMRYETTYPTFFCNFLMNQFQILSFYFVLQTNC